MYKLSAADPIAEEMTRQHLKVLLKIAKDDSAATRQHFNSLHVMSFVANQIDLEYEIRQRWAGKPKSLAPAAAAPPPPKTPKSVRRKESSGRTSRHNKENVTNTNTSDSLDTTNSKQTVVTPAKTTISKIPTLTLGGLPK
eukprot:1953827-Rhodomonas_salina.1